MKGWEDGGADRLKLKGMGKDDVFSKRFTRRIQGPELTFAKRGRTGE